MRVASITSVCSIFHPFRSRSVLMLDAGGGLASTLVLRFDQRQRHQRYSLLSHFIHILLIFYYGAVSAISFMAAYVSSVQAVFLRGQRTVEC